MIAANAESARVTMLSAGMVMLAALLVSMVLGWTVKVSIGEKPIAEIVDYANTLAGGDFSKNLSGAGAQPELMKWATSHVRLSEWSIIHGVCFPA